MKAYPFNVGDVVFHKRFGIGTIVTEWGSIPFLNDEGQQIMKNERHIRPDGSIYYAEEPQFIDCRGIYDVRFGEEAKCRSVNQCWLAVAISQPV